MILPRESEPLDRKIYAQGMALLASVFPSLNLNPEVYYAFLNDLREDGFIGGVEKICRDRVEFFPNTNLVALIREKSQEFLTEKAQRKKLESERKVLGYAEPDYDQIEKNKSDWNALKAKLAKEKGM